MLLLLLGGGLAQRFSACRPSHLRGLFTRDVTSAFQGARPQPAAEAEAKGRTCLQTDSGAARTFQKRSSSGCQCSASPQEPWRQLRL